MRDLIIRYHEIGLKGKNRHMFEMRLVENLRVALNPLGLRRVEKMGGRLLCQWKEDLLDDRWEAVRELVSRVFGIASFSRVIAVSSRMEEIIAKTMELAASLKFQTFAVRAKRSDKKFSQTSAEVNVEVGEAIRQHSGATVDLSNPEIIFEIEITLAASFLSTEKYPGPGGLPVGTAGRVVALLSGGIDSPVAAWKVMKRGCEVVFIHFHSYPHTSKASIEKVKRLAKIVGAYQSKTKVFFVPFAEAQREIVMRCNPKYRVLLYRRLMMRIASEIAKREGALGLVTGESIGQVASQTLPNLRAIEAAANFPIFRPLIGDDKEEIIAAAQRLGTYETSIEPHDDCCSLFVPRNPATSSSGSLLEQEEKKFDGDKLMTEALNQMEREIFN